MVKKIALIIPRCKEAIKSRRLEEIIDKGLGNYDYDIIDTTELLVSEDLKNRPIIFAISLGESGINVEHYHMLKVIRNNPYLFQGSIGGLIVDGKSELFTKSVARNLVFSANVAGCGFPGAPLVEGTGTLDNFNIIAKNLDMDNMGAYVQSGKDLIKRVVDTYESPIKGKRKPKLLALHGGNQKGSNTLALWDMVKENLEDFQIREISLRDGEVKDCIGCNYETCLHFGEDNRCFYGGIITREVYPAILDCDGLVMLCANYNDAISAYLAAFINRLTAIFRVHRFFEKRLYALIVSGYSGSDIVAEQLIAGLNMNKTFFLPARFALMETANNPGSIGKLNGVDDRAAIFAQAISNEFQHKKI